MAIWTTETYERLPWQRTKGQDWTLLLRNCLNMNMAKRKHGSGNRRLCLINQRRDRLKASVLVYGGHFEY